jgi:hypothetical protein
VTELLGLTVHDPDVAFTDLGLALLGGYLGWRLWHAPGPRMLLRIGAILMGGLASAALWGAVFHAFFPAGTATLPGFLAWVPVALSIVVAASAMLELSLRLLLPRIPLRARRSIVAIYAAGFAVVVLLVHESFSSIVYCYTPALILLLIAAGQQAIRSRDTGWTLIAVGLIHVRRRGHAPAGEGGGPSRLFRPQRGLPCSAGARAGFPLLRVATRPNAALCHCNDSSSSMSGSGITLGAIG